MKYLCLIYQDESVPQKLPKAEFEKIHGEYLALTDEIKKSGRLLGNYGLQPTTTATTVRVRSGKVTTTDGPFAETKEQLGGYYLVEARDLNEGVGRHVSMMFPFLSGNEKSNTGQSDRSNRLPGRFSFVHCEKHSDIFRTAPKKQ